MRFRNFSLKHIAGIKIPAYQVHLSFGQKFSLPKQISVCRAGVFVRRVFQYPVLLALFFFCGSVVPCHAQIADPTSAPTAQTLPAADPQATFSTKIAPGTEVHIAVTEEPGVSGTQTVDPDGTIGFSITDLDGNNKTEWRVNIKDKTSDEAKDAIVESLRKYLKAPEVRVIVTKLPRIRVEISGPVEIPGTLELPPNALLSDALAAARYKPNADLSKVRITHRAKEGKQPVPLIVDFAAYQEGQSELDPELKNGDRIVLIALPKETVRPAPRFVRIVGEVVHDAYVPFANGMRVKSAIDQVGGLKPSADRKKLRLVRGVDGKILEIDADKVDEDDPVHNLFLSPGDMLFVNVRDRSLIYSVMGEVITPNTFPYLPDSKITLLQAIEQAGGLTKTADKRKGILRRGFLQNPAQSPELPFDIEKVIKGEQRNWELEAGDAVIILPRKKRPTFLQQALPLLFRFLPFG